MATKQRIFFVGLMGMLLLALLLPTTFAWYYPQAYPPISFPHRYDAAGVWTARDYQNLALRNQYRLYQIPAGTGYVFSPGYYSGPRYFPSTTRYYGTYGLGPYGSYSQRNFLYSNPPTVGRWWT